MSYESTVRWARHLYLAVSMQRLECKIRRQIHQARQHMNLNQPHFPGPLAERLDYLSCYEALRKVELDVQVLESYAQFLVGVCEIREERYVAIEELWRVEIDDAEARCRGVKRRAPRFETDEDYERDDAEEDEEEAEEQTQGGTEPYDWIRSPRWSKDGWFLSGCCKLAAVCEC